MANYSTLPAEWLKDIPKIQTHIHLEGSVRIETMWDIIQKDGIDIIAHSIEELRNISQVTRPMENLEQVLDVFWVHQKVFNSYENIKRITFESIEDAYDDGVKLIELRLAPSFICANKINLSNDDVMLAVLDGIQLGMETYSIEVGIIAIGVRGMPIEENKKALLDVLKFKKGNHPMADRIVGYDLAAGEMGIDFNQYIQLVETAKKAGLHITVHSGEETGSGYIRKSIEILHAERIGHGISAIEDNTLIQLLKEKDIHLEISVTSNWLTKAIPDLSRHPIKKLLQAGISISINTDDPHLMGINLVHEYELLVRLYNFTKNDFIKINKDALQHSFLPRDIIDSVDRKYFKSLSY